MAQGNRTSFAILGFLSLGPMSGYDIKKLVEESIHNFWSESFGQIYPTLRKLTEQGWVLKQEGSSPGGRARHVYSIQEPGRAALSTWLGEPTPPPPVRVELLLKLFFGSRTDRATNRTQVLAFRQQMADDLDRYRAITEALHAHQEGRPELPFWLLTLRFGERDRQAHLEWCDEALALLEELPDRAFAPSPPDAPEVET